MSVRMPEGERGIDGFQFEGGRVRWVGAGGKGDRALAPGMYQIQVSGDGFAHARHEFEIRSRSETHVELILRRGIGTNLSLESVAPAATRGSARLLVHDSEGKSVLDTTVWFAATSATAVHHRAWFLPGTYRVRATLESRVGEAEFRVEPGATRNKTVRIVLK
jgi:hypothetical protein